MTNSPLPPIEEHNLSLAWGKAFLNAMDCPQANPGPMVVSITGFEKGVPIEDGRIRSKLDQFLAAFKKHPCSVSAMIIFPYPQWERMGRPSCAEFKQWCIKGFIPRLKARCKQNGKGLYFERMLDFHGGIPEGLPGKNQLLHLIEWWQEQKQRHHNRPPRSRMQVVCFDTFLDLR
ncbi:MAG: hypothetical protein NTV86_04930 [Planctomycetota bacterium]|nr:hypothetical protein [Planctomycetota bacterium]